MSENTPSLLYCSLRNGSTTNQRFVNDLNRSSGRDRLEGASHEVHTKRWCHVQAFQTVVREVALENIPVPKFQAAASLVPRNVVLRAQCTIISCILGYS
jgi:hypothetical protein